jgi:putative acetyltransferase
MVLRRLRSNAINANRSATHLSSQFVSQFASQFAAHFAEQSAGLPAAQLIMHIAIEDPANPDVLALLEEHLRNMYELSPPESVHALDVNRLKVPEITFWTVREGGVLMGCGALKQLSSDHGEIKSMRTPDIARRRGAGRLMLEHIIRTARERGYARLSLETGPANSFAAAHALYKSAGFTDCGPFGDYQLDPFSAFMTLAL